MDNGFNKLERLLHITNYRHKVISSNIANSDTPNYTAKDVDFKGLFDDAVLNLRTTDAHHINPSGNAKDAGAKIVEQDTNSWGDRNNVELDMEIAKMTENGLLHQAGVRLLSSKIRMFRTAIIGR